LPSIAPKPLASSGMGISAPNILMDQGFCNSERV
jgi:hypothetical protein